MAATGSKPSSTGQTDQAREFVEWSPRTENMRFFADRRVISASESEAAWGVKLGKDLVWVKSGPKDRFLLPKSEVPAEVLDKLLEDDSFKVISE